MKETELLFFSEGKRKREESRTQNSHGHENLHHVSQKTRKEEKLQAKSTKKLINQEPSEK